jgi:hypothetical protein
MRGFSDLYFSEMGTLSNPIYTQLLPARRMMQDIAIIVTSADEEVPAFEVFGSAFVLEGDGTMKKSIVLTDGTTVIGFARLEQMR